MLPRAVRESGETPHCPGVHGHRCCSPNKACFALFNAVLEFEDALDISNSSIFSPFTRIAVVVTHPSQRSTERRQTALPMIVL